MDGSDDANSIDLLHALDESGDREAQPLPPACRLIDVSIAHEGTSVLEAVSLTFAAEACTVIMGPSGSGKSTLLKAAAGLGVPDAGHVEILGVDPAKASDRDIEALRKRNGFVFQDGALWQNLTLYQNLALPLQYHYAELGEPEIRRRIDVLLRELGATARLTLRPSQVSAGERKIVSFMRAIIGDPRLIFMDEPTTSVDTERVDLLIRKLRELKQRRRTIIAVTHNARIASQIADHLVVMKKGRILRSGTLREVSRSGDPEVERILTDVLSETATYDGDILELLDPDANPFFEQN
ncbi:MAG: ABC transporter ATP-binding protein [Spirochaetota bacterium]